MSDSNRNETYLDLFLHPGWKLLLDEMREAHEGLINTAHLLNTAEELHRRKGEIQKLAELLVFEQMVKMQIDEELRDDSDAF